MMCYYLNVQFKGQRVNSDNTRASCIRVQLHFCFSIVVAKMEKFLVPLIEHHLTNMPFVYWLFWKR